MLRPPESVEPDLCFTFDPERRREPWPRPFVVSARTVRLCRSQAPRVAILGWGLGAIGSLMLKLEPSAQLVGVEPSKRLFRAAGKRLRPGVELHQLDALTFLRKSRRRFDLIFDDCFELIDGDAVRPTELQQHGSLVARRLGPGGIYVRNLLPAAGMSFSDQVRDIEEAFGPVRWRRFREWENRLAIAAPMPITQAMLRGLDR